MKCPKHGDQRISFIVVPETGSTSIACEACAASWSDQGATIQGRAWKIQTPCGDANDPKVGMILGLQSGARYKIVEVTPGEIFYTVRMYQSTEWSPRRSVLSRANYKSLLSDKEVVGVDVIDWE
jgi:hypothetical protein